MPYESAYRSFYGESPYSLDILRPPTEKKRWFEMSPIERQRELRVQQEKLAALPQVPERRRNFRLRKAYKPVLNTLQVIGGILNVPSASISGAVKQLVDGSPGFDAQEYFRDIFKFKEQVSWRNVISILAEDEPDKNVWDKKWAQIVGGLALDIALDPLTYFGFGMVKSLMAKRLAKKRLVLL